MATRTATISTLQDGALKVVWTGILNGDNGNGVGLPINAHVCGHITGTFGAGGSISLKGTNLTTLDTTNDPILKDLQDGAYTKTAAAMENVQERPALIYPHCTAGDGTTSLTVTLIVSVNRTAGFCDAPRVT